VEIGVTQPGVSNKGYVCEGILGYIPSNPFPGSITIYRFFNPLASDHFYTTHENELDSKHHQSPIKYSQEGILGYTIKSDAPRLIVPGSYFTKPVYRYFQERFLDHFYTTDSTEIGTTSFGKYGNHEYKCEGVAFKVSAVQIEDTVPIYRYWNEKDKDHFYTTNIKEIDITTVGMEKGGWKCEGIVGYISPVPFHGSKAIYRYYNASTLDHFYTADETELGITEQGKLGKYNFVCEGILGYF